MFGWWHDSGQLEERDFWHIDFKVRWDSFPDEFISKEVEQQEMHIFVPNDYSNHFDNHVIHLRNVIVTSVP